jgi:hypothetical protein
VLNFLGGERRKSFTFQEFVKKANWNWWEKKRYERTEMEKDAIKERKDRRQPIWKNVYTKTNLSLLQHLDE